ncbi:MAG: hypothetical protein ACRYFK_14395 [Janthinobacterium lividum]
MPGSLLTYATALDYLLSLGVRFSLIGRSALTFSGEAPAGQAYPVLLVEGDAQGNESQQTPGLDVFTAAVQVLAMPASSEPTTEQLQALLVETNTWVDMLSEQLRQERSGQLAGVNKLCLPGIAGGAMACGWRVELQLKLAKQLNRTTNGALFAPES